SNVTDKNPFRDVRVREAIFRAIDIDAINTSVMRGLARPAALPVAPTISGFDPKLDIRPKYDPERSKALLADAGYPQGFSFGLSVPNDRYMNDEAIGVAIAGMLAKVGLKVEVLSQGRVRHFADAGNGKMDLCMSGFASALFKDGQDALAVCFQTRGETGGTSNFGRYSNPKIDALTQELSKESDETKRDRIMSEAFKILQDDWAYIPLHVQPSVWAMRDGVKPLHPADDNPRLAQITVGA
ncbi:MAG: ABC transporter substrate-binding protein, partial [Rhizobium pusense]|nr:ABC transporter substrate-binding protein [Agrobacterium pusense]